MCPYVYTRPSAKKGRRRKPAIYIGYLNRNGEEVRERCKEAENKTHAWEIVTAREQKEKAIRRGHAQADPDRMLFAELAAEYERIKVPEQRSGKTTLGHLKRLRAHFGTRCLHEILPSDISAYLAGLKDKLSPRTREHLRIRIQTLFRFAIRELRAFRGENPASLLKVKVPRKTVRYLQADEVQAMVFAAPKEMQPLLAYAFLTGGRKGEICGQLKSNVDLRARIIHVRNSYDGPTKGSQERSIPIPETLVPFLERQMKAAKGRWLFPNADGSMRSKNWKAADRFRTGLVRAGLVDGYTFRCVRRGSREGCGFTEVREKGLSFPCPDCGMRLAGIAIPRAFTFKHARSTYGTHAYRATGNLHHVQKQLGHHDLATTSAHYAATQAVHQLEEANKIPLLPLSVRKLGESGSFEAPQEDSRSITERAATPAGATQGVAR